MSFSKTIRRSLTGLLLLSVCCGPLQAAGAWWNSDWPYRRSVTVSVMPASRLPGRDIAVLTMRTAGFTKPDGSDIRVVAFDRRPTLHRLLMTGPGDQVRLAFATRPGVRRYYVYFGNPNASAVKQLEIRRGVLMETWRFAGGGVRSLSQVKKLFGRAEQLIGRDFQRRIFIGHNPFGPQNKVLSLFTGYLICPASGRYVFVSSSRNASFLLIDDELVVDNGGHHPPQCDTRQRGEIKLTAGLHRLTFYHASGWGDPIAVAAWQPPGRDRVVPIPAEAFAPVAIGEAGAMQRYGRQFTIDFFADHRGEAFMANRYYQRFEFEAVTAGFAGRNVRWKWDFGDGQSSTEQKVEHVYLLPGQYAVTLTAGTFQGELKRTNRISISRPWDEVTANRIDSLRDYAKIVSEYDFAALCPDSTVEAVKLLERAGFHDAVLRAGAAFVAGDEVPAEAVEKLLPAYSRQLIAAGRPAEAVAAFLKAEKMTNNPAVCAAMLVQGGHVVLDVQNKPTRARELFQRAINRYAGRTSSKSIRLARIGVGDAWRVSGDYDKAAEAYAAAGSRLNVAAARKPILKGDFARHVEDYLCRGAYDHAEQYLNRWVEAFPADKLEGYFSLLKVELLLTRERFAEAAVEAEILLGVNPASNYAAELLMLAGEAYRKTDRHSQAEDALKRIVRDYPESPLAADAAKMLKQE
ncbi:MAG: PKD domain-containing protein [Planctomycetota bacterium]|nr:PKD domain-containing protein [Planctomycetota bacterium]